MFTWGSYKSDAHRSTLSGELTPEQVDLLVQALKEAKGAQVLHMSPTAIPDGRRTGYGFSIDDHDGSGGVVMGVDFYPRISPDGSSVDLEIIPTPVPPNVPIHSSLK